MILKDIVQDISGNISAKDHIVSDFLAMTETLLMSVKVSLVLSQNRLCPVFNGWQLAKMKKSIPDMSLPWNL